MNAENQNTLPTLTDNMINDIGEVFKQYHVDLGMEVAKKNWPQYRFIRCSEYDMGEKEPYKVFKDFSFFLIAASLGCASLSNEPHKAVGIIISEHEED